MEVESHKGEGGIYTEIFVWGSNRCGQLGISDHSSGQSYSQPRVCRFSSSIRAIACGEDHTAFVTAQGRVFTFGSNSAGQLGISDRNIKQSSIPSSVHTLASCNVVKVACGWGHTVAITDQGEVFTWGLGDHGALGLPSTDSQWIPAKVWFPNEKQRLPHGEVPVPIPVRHVACGSRHSTFVDEEGRMYSCGAGDAGQLGTASRQRQLLPSPMLFV